ncbi:hypothetical protein Gorai_009124 [Gossypium raimondii]|uniref:DUF4283 domain-containing protein n=1 Tax=Gossypium raimondii TaxID=29730 RepID=A0A7J8PSC0_GOSRA|nr:hypothetical protein [Gossypium raimondii]
MQFDTEARPQKSPYDLCLVGCCLTTNVVHSAAMKNTMANLWHPLGGIQISNLGEKRYLFRFFYEVDVEQMHEIPTGYFSEQVAQQLENFVGKFLDYDTKQFSQGFKNYMRIRVQIDIWKPLMRKRKILIPQANPVYVKFRTQPMRASITLSVWLGEENLGRNFGKEVGREEKRNFKEGLGFEEDQDDMEEEEEELPLENSEGKKRL